MCNGKCGSSCVPALIGKILVIVGALNWGLVGVGMFLGYNLNLVNLLLGSMPMVEAVVYVLVGVAGVMHAIGCKCKKCMAGCTCDTGASKADSAMM